MVIRSQSPGGVDTLNSEDVDGSVLIPLKWGAGFSYNYNNQFKVGFDYHAQDWTKAVFFGQEDSSLTSSAQYRLGMEITPVPMDQMKRASYLARISYRMGGFYEKNNMNLRGNQIVTYGMSFGVGIPWKNERKLFTNTSFNLTYEFRIKGTMDDGLIKETYNIITIGFVLHDFWFIKPKYD
jgi:hypothetical protein